jgi:hypothetical protein
MSSHHPYHSPPFPLKLYTYPQPLMYNPTKTLTLRISEVRNSFYARKHTENTLRHDARKEWTFCRRPELVVILHLQLVLACREMRADVGGFAVAVAGHCW